MIALLIALSACAGSPAAAGSGPTTAPVSPPSVNMDFSQGAQHWTGGGAGFTAEVRDGRALLAGSPVGDGFGTWVRCVSADALDGDEVSLSGQLTGRVDEGRAGLWLRVDGAHGGLAFDNMEARPLVGEVDARPEVSLALAPEAVRVCFGLLLLGRGEIALDDVSLEASWREPATWPPPELLGPDDPLAPLDEQALDGLVAWGRLYGLVRWRTAVGAIMGERTEEMLLQGIAAVEAARDDEALVAAMVEATGGGIPLWTSPPAAPPATRRALGGDVLYVVPGREDTEPIDASAVVLDLRGGAELTTEQADQLLASPVRLAWSALERHGPHEGLGGKGAYSTWIVDVYTEHAPSRELPDPPAIVVLTDRHTSPAAAGAARALVESGQARLLGVAVVPGLGADHVEELLPGRLWAAVPVVIGTTLGAHAVPPAEDPVDLARRMLEGEAAPPLAAMGENVEYRWDDIGLRPARLAAAVHLHQTLEWTWPYWDTVDTDWPGALRETLASVATTAEPQAVHDALERLFTIAGDAHGSVRVDQLQLSPQGWPGVALAWVEGAVRVATVAPDVEGPTPGMVVHAVDGVPVSEALDQRLAHEPGATLAVRRHRVLRELLRGPRDEPVRLEVGEPAAAVFELARTRKQPPSDLVERDVVAGLEGGCTYLDLDRATEDILWAVLPELRTAPCVVLDLRGYPRVPLDTLGELLPGEVWSQRFETPVWTGPGEPERWEDGGWARAPEDGAGLQGRVAVLSDARAVSYAETALALFRDAGYTLVGEPSAGTNGNVCRLTAPGGVSFSLTGLRTRNRDGSRHHGVGVTPQVEVARTAAGVREGRDEALDAAVRLLQQAP